MGGDEHAGSVTGFALALFALFVAMLDTKLPTPLYPLFEERYGFGPPLVTVIFAICAFGVNAGLVLFGNLSDRIAASRYYCSDSPSRRRARSSSCSRARWFRSMRPVSSPACPPAFSPARPPRT